jgi:hypothetical protein
MERISGPVGIAQGSEMLFSDFAHGGPMWTGSGPREVRRPVTFAAPFATPPAVIAAISLFDLDRETNLRADLMTTGVTETGFTLVFRTWGDTRVARIRADWTAIGPLPDDEMWDVP